MAYRAKLAHRLALMKDGAATLALVALAATCERASTPPTGPAARVTQVVVVPESLTLNPSQQQQFAAYARWTTGDSSAPAVTWSASGGVVATNGLYTADTASGDYLVTATSPAYTLSGSAHVHIKKRVVAAVTVTPASASVLAGQTLQLVATPKDSSGNVLTGLAIAWATSTATIATVNASGLVSALAAGVDTVRATCAGQSGRALVTVSVVPVVSVAVSPATASVAMGQTVQLTATPQDASGNPLTGRVVTWATSSSAVATVSASGLVTGVAAGSATITATSEGKNGTASVTVTSGTTGGTILFQENFADTAFASRGWYDNTHLAITDTVHAPGSTSALEVHFLAGAAGPVYGGSARHLFQATPTLYVSYWVKYSANWVGSGQPFHPHEFNVLSTMDGIYDGPADNYLTLYIEDNYQNGGIPRLAMQDNKEINTSYGTPPINLIAVTENRSTGGCNGVVETNLFSECFNAPPWYNDKQVNAAQPYFLPNPGPGYKGNWNQVAAYFQLNSIVNGIGQADGVMQYWVNGALVIDRHDILFRTGARPAIQFNQFLMAFYIGSGSPVDQTLWVDGLTVATAHP